MAEDVTKIGWRLVLLVFGSIAILLYGIALESPLLAVIAVLLLAILDVLYRIETAVSAER